MKRRLLPFLLLGILQTSVTAVASGFSGKVVSVLDGDTIEVLHNTREERIRLNGIDCPAVIGHLCRISPYLE